MVEDIKRFRTELMFASELSRIMSRLEDQLRSIEFEPVVTFAPADVIKMLLDHFEYKRVLYIVELNEVDKTMITVSLA